MANLKTELATKVENGEIAEKSKAPQSIKEWITVMQPQIEKALPTVITAERFTRMALTAVSNNPQLASCTPQSFCGAMMQAAQLGLEPNTPLGQAYLIPYKNGKKGVTECQYQTGYKGLIDLAYRSGEFKNIYAKEVYANDVFSYEYGLEPKLTHKPTTDAEKGDVVYYYAVFTLINGGYGFEVMSKSEMEAFAKLYSVAYARGYSTPWKSNFDEMAKKTVLKKVLKYAPIKTEFVKQVAQDSTIKSELSEDMGTVADETEYNEPFSETPFDVIKEADEKEE